ncbi:LOW QUALITY PROTEIN: hypothetical protein KUTeg_023328, partial [Tegillarca granosa]
LLHCTHHGSHAQSWKGYIPISSTLQKICTNSVILRDSHGVAQICHREQNIENFESKGLAAEIPEDLYHLIKKAVNIRKHLERNRKDKDSKFRLILVESRIHRLARYYKTKKVLAPTWKYESATAAAMSEVNVRVVRLYNYVESF